MFSIYKQNKEKKTYFLILFTQDLYINKSFIKGERIILSTKLIQGWAALDPINFSIAETPGFITWKYYHNTHHGGNEGGIIKILGKIINEN